MAAPQSSAHRPVRPSRPKRRFTLAQANSALPLVRRIVGDIVKTHGLILRLQDVLFGEASGPSGKVKATYAPLFLHLALVLAAGLWLPEPVVRWFRAVAAQLG